MEENTIVEEWLRSLNLVHYTQAFLDNGYDDLEICKQIGHADLDAIGVVHPADRNDILQAVHTLLQEGGTSVYFTLDDESLVRERANTEGVGEPGGPAGDGYEEGRRALVAYPTLQLCAIIREKLAHDGQDISDHKMFTSTDIGLKLEGLAKKYSSELNTHQSDVLQVLQGLILNAQETKLIQDGLHSPEDGESRVWGNYGAMFSVYNPNARSVPPPLPGCPPPVSDYADIDESACDVECTNANISPSNSQRSSDSTCNQTGGQSGDAEDPENGEIHRKNSFPGLGHIFKNMGMRKTGHKYMYKQFEGDLSASEITMSEKDRIELMIQVKEGKLTMQHALEKVKLYEETQRKGDTTDNTKVPAQKSFRLSRASFNLFKFSSFRTKKKPDDAKSQDQTSSSELSTTHKVLVPVSEVSSNQTNYSTKDQISQKEIPLKSQNDPESNKDTTEDASSPEHLPTCFSSPKRHRKHFSNKDNSPKSSPEHSSSGKEERKSFLRSPFSRRKKCENPSPDHLPNCKSKTKDSSSLKNKDKDFANQKTKDNKVKQSISYRVLPSHKGKGKEHLNQRVKDSAKPKVEKGKPGAEYGTPKLLQNRRKGSTSSSCSSSSAASGLYSPRQLRKTCSATYQEIDSITPRTQTLNSLGISYDKQFTSNTSHSSHIPPAGGRLRKSFDSTSDTSEGERTIPRITKNYGYRSQENLPATQTRKNSRRADSLTNLRTKQENKSGSQRKGLKSDGPMSDGDELKSTSLTSLSRLPICKKSVGSPPRSPRSSGPSSPRSSASPTRSPVSKSPSSRSPITNCKTSKQQTSSIDSKSVKRHFIQQTEADGADITLKQEEEQCSAIETRKATDYASVDICQETLWQKRKEHAVTSIPTYHTLPHMSLNRNGLYKVKHQSRDDSCSSAGDEGLSSELDEPLDKKTDMLMRQTGGRNSLSERVKGLGRDVRKTLAKLRHQKTGSRDDEILDDWYEEDEVQGPMLSTVLSAESTSTSPSSMSVDEDEPTYKGPFVGHARVIRDYIPSPYDREALKLKRGDLINIISKSDTGMWRGIVNCKVGTFKFINVELLPDQSPQGTPVRQRQPRRIPRRPRPRTVQELLDRLALQHLTSIFQLHGFETLEDFSSIEDEDLDELCINNPQDRAKIITAASMLQDYEDLPDSEAGTPISSPVIGNRMLHSDQDRILGNANCNANNVSPMRHPSLLQGDIDSRDSGCFTSSETLPSSEGPLRYSNVSSFAGEIRSRASEPSTHHHLSQPLMHVNATIPVIPGAWRSQEQPQTQSVPPRSSQITEQNHTSSQCVPSGPNKNIHKSLSVSQRTSLMESGIEIPSKTPVDAQAGVFFNSPQGSPKSLLRSRESISPIVGSQSPPGHQSPVRKLMQDSGSFPPIPIRGRSSSTSAVHGSVHGSPRRGAYAIGGSPIGSPIRTPSPIGSPIQNRSPRKSIPQVFSSLGSPKYRNEPPALPKRIKPHVPERKSSLSRHWTCTSEKDITWTSNVRDYANLQAEGANKTNGHRFSSPGIMEMQSTHVGPQKSKLPTPSAIRITRHESLLVKHKPRPLSVSIESLLVAKLESENIDLTLSPYTDKGGFCGIPPCLVQRYAEELNRNVQDIAVVLDECRVRHLHNTGQSAVPNDFLGDSCVNAVNDVNVHSLKDFLASIGMPMYFDVLFSHNLRTLDLVQDMKEINWRQIGVTDSRHLRRLVNATEILKIKLDTTGRTSMLRNVSDIRDKV